MANQREGGQTLNGRGALPVEGGFLFEVAGVTCSSIVTFRKKTLTILYLHAEPPGFCHLPALMLVCSYGSSKTRRNATYFPHEFTDAAAFRLRSEIKGDVGRSLWADTRGVHAVAAAAATANTPNQTHRPFTGG